jgi:D-3-phosphoglycerate dehydrogenase
MTKVLVATVKPFAPVAVTRIKQIIEEAGFELDLLEKYIDQSEFISKVSQADALIVRSDLTDKQLVEAGRELKIIVRAGAGYDNIDLVTASGKGIVVMNTPGQNANAVAELALGMMVYMARNQFNGTPGTELLDKTLGVQAYGHVGKRVARIAKGFGMEVYVFDPFIERPVIEADGFSLITDVRDLYSTCQYVSVHIPADESTIKSVDYNLMSCMPQGAVLVNTARKEVICEDSLLKIMENRPDFRYVSDIAPDCAPIFEQRFKGRFFFTPKKMGAQTEEANINAGVAAAHQIVRFFKTGDTTFQVNK